MRKTLAFALVAGALLLNAGTASALTADLTWLGEFNPFWSLTYADYNYQ